MYGRLGYINISQATLGDVGLCGGNAELAGWMMNAGRCGGFSLY
ncbi:hypothetical protein [Magnetococcus marinus]|nr:hypothetical protein [Magnetococcus marinus]